ncbi:MAG: Lrp/AsnC family transcriptional regulator [Rhizobiales bacterium]|nr:Lrp/AsnC family transcriptional regulator [Hyphomicrobiales bacterium]
MKESSYSAGLGPEERQILAILQRDCRISNQELADRVNLSPSACWRRVQALEKRGVIRGYVALVDPEPLGLLDCVFAHIRIERHAKQNIDQFVCAVMKRPEVLACYAMSGDEDYMLRVLAPNVRSYDLFLEDFLLELPTVAHVKSNFVLRQIKDETRIPTAIIPSLMED